MKIIKKTSIFTLAFFFFNLIGFAQVSISGLPIPCAGSTHGYSAAPGLGFSYPADYSSTINEEYRWEVVNGTMPSSASTYDWSNFSIPITWSNIFNYGKIRVYYKLTYRNISKQPKFMIYSSSINIRIKKLASSVLINGTSSIECNSSGTYTYTATESYADNYNWTWPAGWTLISGQGTRTLKVKCNLLNGGDITVKATNNCNTTGITNVLTVLRDCPPYKKYVTASANLNEHTSVDDYILANTSNGWLEVLNGQNVRFKAGNYINIKPNFRVKAGGYFKAKIGNCLSCTAYRPQNNEKEQYFTNKLSFLNVYPNPNNGQFNITIQNIEEKAIVEIYSITGKRVFYENSVKPTSIINLTDQPKGIYLVKVTTGDHTFSKKVIYK